MTSDEWARIIYFRPGEFDSPDRPGSGAAAMRRELVGALDALRIEWGRPLVIGSGYRTREHNLKVGGKPNSAHLRGLAADIRTRDLRQAIALAIAAARLGFKRIGVDMQGRFVHVDVDAGLPNPVTWYYNEDRLG